MALFYILVICLPVIICLGALRNEKLGINECCEENNNE